MKKNFLLITLLSITLTGCDFEWLPTPAEPEVDVIKEIPEEPIDKNEIQEINFSKEQLQQYYGVYENPYAIHIRKAFDSYLNGSNEGVSAVAISSPDKTTDSGLENFKEYLKSKFIVFAVNDAIGGGQEINIIFQDKPDKIFNAWVYQEADENYDLRGFWQNNNFDEKEMQKIQKAYKELLEDYEHSL